MTSPQTRCPQIKLEALLKFALEHPGKSKAWKGWDDEKIVQDLIYHCRTSEIHILTKDDEIEGFMTFNDNGNYVHIEVLLGSNNALKVLSNHIALQNMGRLFHIKRHGRDILVTPDKVLQYLERINNGKNSNRRAALN